MGDADDWFAAADEPEAPAAAEATVVEDVGGEPELEEEDAEEPAKRRAPQDQGDRLILNRVWKRPVNLQYSYLYDYRHNYYDDVIDYLDRRQRGITRDIPRPQTWAERALRTYNSKPRTTASYQKRESDINLLSDMRTSARFYNYHSREYINTTYSKYMY